MTSSTLAVFAPQPDGRVLVREVHLDARGTTREVAYLAPAGTTQPQAQAAMVARAAQMDAELAAEAAREAQMAKDAEVEANWQEVTS